MQAASAEKPPAPPTAGDDRVTLPMTMFFVDADEWDGRAGALGGTSNALLAGLAARLAQRVGRVAADGSVNVGMPLNERAPGDTRANAVTNVDVTLRPSAIGTDLREIRAVIKNALIRHQDVPDERWALLPLVPLIPKRIFRQLISVVTGGATTVVSSNLGVIDPAVNRPDGSDAPLFRDEVGVSGRDQRDDAPHQRSAGLVVGAGARPGIRIGPRVSVGSPNLERGFEASHLGRAGRFLADHHRGLAHVQPRVSSGRGASRPHIFSIMSLNLGSVSEPSHTELRR